jgi:type IV secretion system protein VirB3
VEREDRLYQAMTRDAMILGVTLDCFILEVIGCSIAFLVSRSLWVLPLGGLFHLLCFWKCLDDADYFSIWWTAFGLTRKGANGDVWGGVSYDPE